MTLDFQHPAIGGGDFEGVLLPITDGGGDAWFARGSVHVTGGSSGAGKSSLILPLLRAQEHGETFLGHQGAGLRPYVLYVDRGRRSNTRTMKRLGLHQDPIPSDPLPTCVDDEAIAEILAKIEQRYPNLPEVVFIEGADMLVSDANKAAVVARFMRGLQEIADHYFIAIVLSVGSPKSDPKNKKELTRDRLFGSGFWGRMADTIVVVEAAGDGTGDERTVTVLHRDAGAEKFPMVFNSRGRLELVETPAEEPEPIEGQYKALADWAMAQPSFTLADLKAAFPKLSGSTRRKYREKLIDRKMLAETDEGVYRPVRH